MRQILKEEEKEITYWAMMLSIGASSILIIILLLQ